MSGLIYISNSKLLNEKLEYRSIEIAYLSLGPNLIKTPEIEEEDKILESYLMGMKIEEGQLVLPPVSARPDGFDLFYQRRSLRKTYQYEMDGEQFSLTVCKDQANNVDTNETDMKSLDETPAMVLFYQ